MSDHADRLVVEVPSWRATKDISIEADVIEEIARCVGYDNLEPRLPQATVRSFEPNVQHEMEQRTLRAFCEGAGCNEIHRYLWYHDAWLAKLGYDPGVCIEVRNPTSAPEHRLRHSLMPGMLQALDLNRHHLDAFRLIELGSVYPPGADVEKEFRNVGLVWAVRQKGAEDDLLLALKGAIETWSIQVLGIAPTYARLDRTDPNRNEPRTSVRADSSSQPVVPAPLPWTHDHKSAAVFLEGKTIGTASALPLELRNRIDEHLKAWSVVWAELRLDHVATVRPRIHQLPPVPAYPLIGLDFSALIDADRDFVSVTEALARFEHPLLISVTYVGSYEGKSIPANKRSLTFHTRMGHAQRTLVDEDVNSFRTSFESHLGDCGLELRRGSD